MDTKAIGPKIKILRELRGFTQEELATQVGLTYQMIQKYERGESKITVELLSSMADALDCTIFEILDLDYYRLKEEVAEYKPGKDLFKLTREEQEIVKLFRRLRNPKLRESAISMLKGLIALTSDQEKNHPE